MCWQGTGLTLVAVGLAPTGLGHVHPVKVGLNGEVNGDDTQNKGPELTSNLAEVLVNNNGLIELSGK